MDKDSEKSMSDYSSCYENHTFTSNESSTELGSAAGSNENGNSKVLKSKTHKRKYWNGSKMVVGAEPRSGF